MTQEHQPADDWIILPGTTIGGEVGTFRVDFTIRNRSTGLARSLNGLVDTGASYTVIPEIVLDELGIERDDLELFSLADGSVQELAIGWADMELQGRIRPVYVVFGTDRRKILPRGHGAGGVRPGRRRQVPPPDSRRADAIGETTGVPTMPVAAPNRLYFGDNLSILREHVADASVDLIYLDPPFNSNATYNVLFRERSGDESAAQITAFDDTWHWSLESERAYQDVVAYGPAKSGQLLAAMRAFLGQNDMMAYLTMMAQRMIELHRVLKPTGSIYLHCDPTASHYLKLLLDAVFGATNFRSELIWRRQSAHSDARNYGSVHDTMLFYAKSDEFVWNPSFQPYDPDYVEQYYRYTDDGGRRFMSGDLGSAGLQGGGYEYEWKGVVRVWRVPIRQWNALMPRDGYSIPVTAYRG